MNGLENGVEPIYPLWKKKIISDKVQVHKSNSTSSLFIDSTISSPKTPELLRWYFYPIIEYNAHNSALPNTLPH